MADGLNQIRAIRVVELVTDWHNLLNYVLAIRIAPTREAYNEEGYQVLRRCEQEAQALLARPYSAQPTAGASEEQIRTQLRRIITDAAVRRFQAQKIYMRAYACQHWENSRREVLQGQAPHAGHLAALHAARDLLRAQIAAITDQRVELSLRQSDTAAGKWLVEDPPLAVIQHVIANM